MLGNNHDSCGWVARNVPWENGSVDNEEVVRPVDLCVGVDDSGASASPIVRTHLVGA